MALKEICGLWLGKTKKGASKMSGSVKEERVIPAGAWLMVLKNEKRPDHKDPDYRLFVQVPDDDPSEAQLENCKRDGTPYTGVDDVLF